MVSLSGLAHNFADLYWIGLTRARWYWYIGKPLHLNMSHYVACLVSIAGSSKERK